MEIPGACNFGAGADNLVFVSHILEQIVLATCEHNVHLVLSSFSQHLPILVLFKTSTGFQYYMVRLHSRFIFLS